jgi:putative tryptophan/tyrosine transport system substrate-binding protein
MLEFRRRELIALLGGAAAAWPLAARAQQRATMPHVGILNYAAAQDVRVSQFQDALRRLGYVEGKNLAVTYRWADGALERLPELAAELVASKVDVIIALGPAVWAAKRATTMVPIVIAFSGDPVGDGVVSSFARPGGNITGFSYMSTDLAAKRLELLSNAFAKESRIGILYNPQEPATRLEMQETEAAARPLGVTLLSLAVRHPDDLEQAFTAATHERADALLVFTHGFAVLNRARITALAARHRLPTLYGWRDFVDEGGLMSYGPDIDVLVRQAASYVDRIIRGERPGDLPVEQPTRLRLVINLKTAKALGLEMPPILLARADEVIE